MLIQNTHADHGAPLDARDISMFDSAAVREVAAYLAYRPDHRPTPLHALPGLADEFSVAAVHVKDEGHRLGLGSFKALGGAYAVIRLVLEEAGRRVGRAIGYGEMLSDEVRAIAATLTIACATDGNHGRSVAQGAELIGARCTIFVHARVSDARRAAIARFGSEIVQVEGTYDDSVVEAERVAADKGWILVSDTSWPGYERVPGLVMQGYCLMVHEAIAALPSPPTHVFVQAGVGGLAAAVAGHLALALGDARPVIVVVEPDRAACLFETARAGHPVKIAHGEPTVMAMLECYEPSPLAWRVLSRAADAFMTVGEDDAVAVMNRLARPAGDDPAIVSGESGGAGLAGFIRIARNAASRAMLDMGSEARIFVINSEGATDPERYRELTGMDALEVGIH
jgi:diaminopropionate ammonia-lyase